MSIPSIRSATVDDVEPLRLFGIDAFTRTFGHLYPPEDLQSYLDESYDIEVYLNWINNPADYFLHVAVI
jgi:hypothetical protein